MEALGATQYLPFSVLFYFGSRPFLAFLSQWSPLLLFVCDFLFFVSRTSSAPSLARRPQLGLVNIVHFLSVLNSDHARVTYEMHDILDKLFLLLHFEKVSF